MITGRKLVLLLSGLLLAATAGGAWAQSGGPAAPEAPTVAMGTSFTYQGLLESGGAPVSGVCDFQFRLFDAASGGTQLGNTESLTDTVTSGRFTVLLNSSGVQFGAVPFHSDARWLEIAVRCPAGGGGYTTLTPRQPLTAAPFALALPGLHTEPNSFSANIVGGYSGNSVNPGVYGAVIAGGGYPGSANTVTANFTTIGGGLGNDIYQYAATVSGGRDNTANGQFATVSGGDTNTASANYATVGGGDTNAAGGLYATVAGGRDNTASGQDATVPGGQRNTASGDWSFAGGRYASAIHSGAFVWASGSTTPISSTAANQFLVRASGGVTMYTDSGATTGVRVFPGSGTWTSVSDRNAKANFAPVDGVAILNALMGLPIETWNYQAQDAAIRHIGPMAQDFYAAFGVGETPTGISTIDADGVALAAIQGLYSVVQEKETRIAALEAQVAALETTVETFRRNVSTTGEAASSGKTGHRAVSTDTIQLALVLIAGLLAGAMIGAGAFALGRRQAAGGKT